MQDPQGFSGKEESGLAGGGAEASQVSQEALWRQDVSGPCPGNKHNKSTPTLLNSHQFNRKTEVASSIATGFNGNQFICNMTEQSPVPL